MWFLQNNESGIFNLGTGKTCTFKKVAETVIDWLKDHDVNGEIKFIDFPKNLIGSYQSYTEADLTLLRKSGYRKNFLSIEEGISDYLSIMHKV